MLFIALVLTSSALFCASESAPSPAKAPFTVSLKLHAGERTVAHYSHHTWEEKTHPHLPHAGTIVTVIGLASCYGKLDEPSSPSIAGMLTTYFPIILAQVNEDACKGSYVTAPRALLIAALQKAVFRVNEDLLKRPKVNPVINYIVAAQYGTETVLFDVPRISKASLPLIAEKYEWPCEPGEYFPAGIKHASVRITETL